jgi:hypothetical protein
VVTLHRTVFLTLLLVTTCLWSANTQRAEQQTVEQQKVDIEKARVEGDLRLREQELQLKRDELRAKQEEEHGQGFFAFNGVNGTIAVALIGLLATAITALIQGRANYRTQRESEKRKLESDLILKAIETGDLGASTRNLKFLLKGGFIEDPHGTIALLAEDVNSVPVLPARAYTSGAFKGIPAEGVGGEPEFNILKNRDVPPKLYTPMTIEKMLALPLPGSAEVIRGPRSNWPTTVHTEIDRIESQGVTLEGYVINAHLIGPTAANAQDKSAEGRDWAVVLGSSPTESTSKINSSWIYGIVSPRIRAIHPEWTLVKLRELIDSRQRVRVGGWPLLIKHRVGAATYWRIHPIVSIEVQKEQGWSGLSDSSK